MKLSRYASQKDNPAVKGDLTAEEIVRADWERNFKKSGVSFEQAKGGIKAHVDAGMPVFRMRNTIILLSPDPDYETAEFHTITADPYEVYVVTMLMFMLGLARSKNTQTVYSYVNDQKPVRMAEKTFGADNVIAEPSDEPDKGKLKLSIDIASVLADGEMRVAAGQEQ